MAMAIGRLFYLGPKLDELHQHYAKRGRIDTRAQAVAHCVVRIEAPVGRVWELLADIPSWPGWGDTVRAAEAPEGVAVDAPFTWDNQGSKIASRVAVLTPEQEITWTGVEAATRARAVHRLRLEARDGGTVVIAEESIAGLLLPLFFTSEKLRQGMERWMSELKSAAESRPRVGVSRR